MLLLRAAAAVAAALLVFLPAPSGAFAQSGAETQPATQESPQAAPPREAGTVEVGEAATVTSALQGQDGVRIQTMCTHCNSANVQVGGLSADLVPIFYGGFPLVGGLATTFVMSMLPPDSVAEAQIVRGAGSPSAPGPAAGGEIQLTAARPTELPWADAFLDSGSFGRRTGLVRAAGPLTSWLSGAVTLGSESVDAVPGEGAGSARGWNAVAAVDRTIADARAFLAPAQGHRVEFGYSRVDEDDEAGRGAFDYQVWAANGGNPEDPVWTREDTSFERDEYRAGWEWRRPDGGSVTLRGLAADREQSVISQDTTDPTNATSAFSERYRIDEKDRWALLRYSRPLGLTWRLAGALEASRVEVGAQSFAPNATTPDQDAVDEVDTESALLEAEFMASDHWDIVAGVRYDRITLEGSTTSMSLTQSGSLETDELLPRVTIKYRPAAAWTVRLAAGRTARAPQPIFTEVCCGRRYLTNAVAGVGVETATSYALEGIYQPSPALKISAYAARTDFDDLVQQFVSYSVLYRQIYANTNVPEARSETAEVALRWTPWHGVTLDASMGWLSFFNTGAKDVPIRYVPFTGSGIVDGTVRVDRLPNRPLRSASAGATFELPRGIVLGLQASYTGPQYIQQWQFFDPLAPDLNGLSPDLRAVDGFWLTNASLTAPLGRHLTLTGGVDNIGDFVQNDLDDPTRDYNWGPLTGRAYRLGLRVSLPR